jgi:dienelactone hydrolase
MIHRFSLPAFFSICLLPAANPPAVYAAESAAITAVQAWTKQPRDKRQPIAPETAKAALTKAEAEAITKLLRDDYAAGVKESRAEEVKAKVLTHEGKKMKYQMLKFGSAKEGLPLFISMHGGGGAPPQVNESQWENQIKLGQAYKPASGIYVAPRAPTDTWNLWHEGHIDPLFQRLIQNMVVFENVDPNKVYFMGYSAGGDGVYQLAPRMADRLAAAAMMAGHPNETSPLGLRNIGFTIHMGAQDSGFNRNKVAGEWAKKLEELHKADPAGYVHEVKIHEGRGHWMNLEDRAAIPWMEKFTRKPLPEKIVWRQDDVTHPRFYWLAVPAAEAKAGQDLTAERKGQNIQVTASANPHVTVLLNDAMLDLDQPVSVSFNGKPSAEKKAVRSIAVIQRTLEERGDPGLIFSAEISLP